jgi:peptidyl-Lys metalloendopeptidase
MAGILIMEATHWTNIADTHDFAWSSPNCKALALSDPSQAVDNAASFAFFAVNDAGQEIP